MAEWISLSLWNAGADPGIPERHGSGSTKKQFRRNFQTDKQNKKKKSLKGGGGKSPNPPVSAPGMKGWYWQMATYTCVTSMGVVTSSPFDIM